MERAGEFKNLAGSGQPLPERVVTHFGDDDAADRMMTRIMAENNVKPESIELRNEFRPRYKAFRARLARPTPADARLRASLEHELGELCVLHERFRSAAVKDSFTFNLMPTPPPRPGETLEEELAKPPLRADRTEK